MRGWQSDDDATSAAPERDGADSGHSGSGLRHLESIGEKKTCFQVFFAPKPLAMPRAPTRPTLCSYISNQKILQFQSQRAQKMATFVSGTVYSQSVRPN